VLAPGAIAVAVFLVLVPLETGYDPTTWYPAAFCFLLILAAVVAARSDFVGSCPLAVRWAVALLAAFTAWSVISIAWADVQGDAWDGANRTLLYVIVYTLFALLPWRADAAAVLIGAFAFGTAVIGGVVLVQATLAPAAEPYFLEGRLAEPAGYANAAAALFLAAFWPALFLGSRREVPPFLRAVMLAASGLLLTIAVAAQSRASVVALVIVLVLYLALMPNRVRAALFLVPVAAGAALALPWTVDLYEVARDGDDFNSALTRAAATLGLSCAFLLVAGTALARLDRRISFSERAARNAGRGLAIGAAVLATSGSVSFAALDHPVRRVEHAWQSFKRGTDPDASSHLTAGLGGARYDYWRVALDEFAASPITGVGVDNYAVDYLRERKTTHAPLYPHSIELRLLAQTGVIGTALFGGFLLAALIAAARTISRATEFERGVAAAAIVTFAYWFVHGSVDWLWELPALAAPAFAWLGMAARISRPRGETVVTGRSRAASRAIGTSCAAVLASVAAVSLVLPWFAAREVERAGHDWQADSAAAFEALDRARKLNFLSDTPDLVTATIARRVGDRPRMRRAFERVLERNPKNWYAHLELGALDALEGRRTAALRRLQAAKELNPLEPVVTYAMRRVAARKPLSLRTIDRMLAAGGHADTVGGSSPFRPVGA
jgi:tetratricopeptide (TPR) repeat protein